MSRMGEEMNRGGATSKEVGMRIRFGGDNSKARPFAEHGAHLHKISGDAARVAVEGGRVVWEMDLRSVVYAWRPEDEFPADELEALWRGPLATGTRVRLILEPA